MSIIVKGGGGSTAKELVNSTGTKLADLEKAGSGKVKVAGGLGNTPPEKVLQGSIYSDESGVRRTGTMEDITPDLNAQSDLIKEIRAMIVGRATEANATPEDILKGKKAYVGGKLVEGTLSLNPVEVDVSLGKTPYSIFLTSAVVLNNEIHILGGYNNRTSHYKWEGSKWVRATDLIRNFSDGGAVVLNNEIHALGGDGSQSKNHYVLRGSSWTSISSLPYNFYYSSAVVLNNEIHLLGGYENRTDHYKWNGKAWSRVSTIPYEFFNGAAVVLNNEIHLLGGEQSSKNHYKWDGSKWISVSTIPEAFRKGSAVVLNGEIYLIGGSDALNSRYKWDGSAWTKLTDIPIDFRQGIAVMLNGTIYIARNSNFLALQKTLYERG